MSVNKKIVLGILSMLLLTIAVVANQELSSPAFHETGFTSATNLINIPPSPVNVLSQIVSVPVGGAELTATVSLQTNTGAGDTLIVRVLDNGVAIPPGALVWESSSDGDGFQAGSFTFGKTITPGSHTIVVQASGSGQVNIRSLETEIEELP